MDRREIGAWLEGPGAVLHRDDTRYAGERLGLPEDGPGSIARTGRRLAGVALDWAASLLVASLAASYGSPEHSVLVLAVFAVETYVGMLLGGASFGHRVVGLRVVHLGGGPIGPLRALLRVALLVLVIPAVVYDRDGRGLHDRLAGTAVLRAR